MATRYVSNAGPVPVRATYFNLYKWPESDAEFVKSISSANVRKGDRFMYGLSCRQLFLRSYTFSREEDYTIMKCPGRAKDKAPAYKRKRNSGAIGRRKKSADSIFRRFLSCAAKIHVVD